MTPMELLKIVGEVLDRVGCERFTTGSVASMIYGEPRYTNDVDVVVRMNEAQARRVAEAFTGQDWYCSEDAAIGAVQHRSMFNIIHAPSGFKVDVMVASMSPHNASRFARCRLLTMADGRVERIASPEDVILKKLQFFNEGGGLKHSRDIASVVAMQGAHAIDWEYMQRWAEELGVTEGVRALKLEMLPPNAD